MRKLTAGCEARVAGQGVGALRCPELPAWPEVQVVPAIHAHFGNAYSTWQTAATLLHSPHDAVAAWYLGSVKMWLRYKPTLVALANAPLTPRHWHELWRCLGTPYMHGFTLGDLFEHSAFEQMEAIRAITGVAVSECAFEAPLEVCAWAHAPPSPHACSARVRACAPDGAVATVALQERELEMQPEQKVTRARTHARVDSRAAHSRTRAPTYG